MPITPLASLQELLPKGQLGTNGADIITELQQQQQLGLQSQRLQQEAAQTAIQTQVAQQELDQKRIAAQRDVAFRAALAAAGKNPTSDAYAEMERNFPEKAAQLKIGMGQLQAKEKAMLQNAIVPAYSSFYNKNLEAGVGNLEKWAGALDKAGQNSTAAQLRSIIEQAKREGPAVAAGALGHMIHEISGKESYEALNTSLGIQTDKKTKEGLAEQAVAGGKSKTAQAASDVSPQFGIAATAQKNIGLVGAQTDQASGAAMSSRATAGKTNVEKAQLEANAEANRRKLAAEAGSAESKQISDAAAAANASRAEAAKADLLVDQARKAGAVPPELLQRQAIAKTISDEATARWAYSKGEAELQSLQAQGAKTRADKELMDVLLPGAAAKQTAETKQATAAAQKALGDLSIEQQRLMLERDKAEKDREMKLREMQAKNTVLGDGDKERIAKNVNAATDSYRTIKQIDGLIGGVEKSWAMAGVAGWPWEKAKGLVGAQDATSALRKDLARFFTKDMLGQIPPGALSDKEQTIIREGIPSSFDSKDLLTRYLNAAKSVAREKAEWEDAQAQWQSFNGGSAGNARSSFTINGLTVPAGTTQRDLMIAIGLKKERDRLMAEGGAQ